MLWLAWKKDVKSWSLRDTGDDCDDEMAVLRLFLLSRPSLAVCASLIHAGLCCL